MVAALPSSTFDVHKIKAAAYTVAVDGDGFRFSGSNRACLDMTGLVKGFHAGLRPHDIFPADLADALVARYRACAAGEAVSHVASLVGTDGSRDWRTTLFPLTGDDGEVSTIVGICSRVEAGDAAPLTLNRTFSPADLALDVIDGGFWVLDLATQDFETTRQLTEMIAGPGHPPLGFAEYIGRIHADDLCLEVPEPDRDITVEFRIYDYEGRMRWFQTRRRTIRDEAGNVTHVVGMVLDITEQKSRMTSLENEVSRDILTQIKNRRAFDRAADRAFDEDSGHASLAVLLIDLDDFKSVNDRQGRHCGDEVLRETARRLDGALRQEDTLSRIGGDEFAILLRGASPKAVDKVIARIEAALSPAYEIEGRTLYVAASWGTAIRLASDRGVGEVVERADHMLRAMKRERSRLTA